MCHFLGRELNAAVDQVAHGSRAQTAKLAVQGELLEMLCTGAIRGQIDSESWVMSANV
jgi:hypothetical protein